jgi:uncharacterized SAM-binding protein YcdF (DUF218 family)
MMEQTLGQQALPHIPPARLKSFKAQLYAHPLRSVIKRVSRWAGFIFIILVSAFIVGFFIFAAWLDRWETAPSRRSDGIVALTGGSQRIGDAIDLLDKGYGSRLLISGVNERTSREEIARLNPGQRRLFDCCVDLDYRARNTIGNAVETRRWAQQHAFGSLIVVTSNYHMPRALLEIGHALPRARLTPFTVVVPSVNSGEWWQSPATARILVSEYVKFIAMWVRTKFESDPENSSLMVLFGAEPVMRVSKLSERH